MSSFTGSSFHKKLSVLNASQQSIQTLSLWLIHHRKHASSIVSIWTTVLKRAKPDHKLTLIYLANDVIQNSKKKGSEFYENFKKVLPDAFKYAYRDTDAKQRQKMDRILSIWKERGVYGDTILKQIQSAITGKKSNGDKSKQKVSKVSNSTKPTKETEPVKKKRRKELTLMEEIEKDLTSAKLNPPDSSTLVKTLISLEESASSDAPVREKIASFPPEVSDISLLDKIKDRAAGDKLAALVDDASAVLSEYNSRLSAELDERKNAARLLRLYTIEQKELLEKSDKQLLEFKDKLERVSSVRKELKLHLQSLPDMTRLPSLTDGLAPLPSAGDLFSL